MNKAAETVAALSAGLEVTVFQWSHEFTRLLLGKADMRGDKI
jgi:hypothetical protein